MSITAVNPTQGHAFTEYVAPPVSRDGQGAAEQAFASYKAPEAASSANPAIGQGATPSMEYAASGIPSAATVRLQDKLRLIKRAGDEIKFLAHRIRNNPSLGPESPRAKDVGKELATLEFVVSETKKSGLYGALQQAAIDRLKESGNYEDVISQILEKEAAQGRPRNRAWAENCIERQFDFDCVDVDRKERKPYFEMGMTYGEARAVCSEGTATFFGNRTDVYARGAFDIEFTGKANQLFYTVENRITGEKSAPRPYDPRGTAIEADGLRADMIGMPAPGDMFSVSKFPEDLRGGKSEHYVGYLDPHSLISAKTQKIDLFDRLFSPMIRHDPTNAFMKRPSETIRDIIFNRA